MLEVEVGSLVLQGMANTCGPVSSAGTIKVRIANLPVTTVYMGMTSNHTARTGADCGQPIPWVDIPVQIQGNGIAFDDGTVRFGCDPLTITKLTFDEAVLQSSLQLCGGFLPAAVLPIIKARVFDTVSTTLNELLVSIDRGRACLDINAGDPTPVPAPCTQTPCASSSACAGGDCGMATCTCGTCTP